MSMLKMVSSRFLKTSDDGDFKQDVSNDDKKWVKDRCTQLNEWNEDTVMIFWIRKIKKEEYKREARLVVLTDHRLFTVKKNKTKYEIRREGHLLDLVKVQEQGLILFLQFRGFELKFQCSEDTDTIQILHTLYHNYMYCDPGFPPKIRCKWIDQYNTSQEKELKKKVPVRTKEIGKWDKAVRSFKSYCQFFNQDSNSLSEALRAMLSREKLDKHDEIWVRNRDLQITDNAVLAGLVISLSFTAKLLDGLEIIITNEKGGNKHLLDACRLFIRYNSTVKSLVLDGVAQTSEWGSLLYDGLNGNNNSALKRFGLKNCKIHSNGVDLFINKTKQLSKQPSCIYLTRSGASSKQVVALLGIFIGKSDYGNGLVELDLSHNPLEKRGTQTLAKRISKDFPDLRVLKLQQCHVDIPILLNALEINQKNNNLKLEELDLSYNKMEQRDGLILSRILCKAKSMAGLGIAGCSLTGVTIAACIAALLVNEHLKFYVRINCSDNNIGTEAAIMIGSIFVFNDRIMSLKLNNCNLTHEGTGYILKSLLNQPRLRILELNNNVKRNEWKYGKYQVNQELRSLLDKSLVLESLSIRNDPERGYQIDLDHLLFALKNNTTLLALDITGNSMTNDNILALKTVIQRNQVLQELKWDNNNITPKHIVAITHALKQNQSLQIVQFPQNDFNKIYIKMQKDKKKKEELDNIKKEWYKAIFENNTKVGFDTQSIKSVGRSEAKRNSFMPMDNEIREKYGRDKFPTQQKKNQKSQLGVPQW